MPNRSIEDGSNNNSKRVSTKPKWNRLDVETKVSISSYSSQQQSSSRPPRNRREDRRYDDYREDRPSRRGERSNRGSNVPSSSSNRSGPRSSATAATVVTNNGSMKSSTSSSSRGGNSVAATTNARNSGNTGTNSQQQSASTQYIRRSNMPSYTESKTPGLNGNPIMQKNEQSSQPQQAYADAKKPKPLLGRPIIIEGPIPVMPLTYGATYYYNGPAPFTIDAIANIKESIKKQM